MQSSGFSLGIAEGMDTGWKGPCSLNKASLGQWDLLADVGVRIGPVSCVRVMTLL